MPCLRRWRVCGNGTGGHQQRQRIPEQSPRLPAPGRHTRHPPANGCCGRGAREHGLARAQDGDAAHVLVPLRHHAQHIFQKSERAGAFKQHQLELIVEQRDRWAQSPDRRHSCERGWPARNSPRTRGPSASTVNSARRLPTFEKPANPVGHLPERIFHSRVDVVDNLGIQIPRLPSAGNGAAYGRRPWKAGPARSVRARIDRATFAAPSMVLPMASSFARTFAVPAGRMPSGTLEWAMPFTTSLMVPSPPAARIKSAPRSNASLRQFRPRFPDPRWESLPRHAARRRGISSERRSACCAPPESARERIVDEKGLPVARDSTLIIVDARHRTVAQEIEELRDQLRRHEYLYYVLDQPEITRRRIRRC